MFHIAEFLNPKESSQIVAKHIESTSGKVVTPQTIRYFLHNAGIKGQWPRKKPFICEMNRKKCSEFVKCQFSHPLPTRGDLTPNQSLGTDGHRTLEGEYPLGSLSVPVF